MISIESAIPRLKKFIERQTPTLNARVIALGYNHREHLLHMSANRLAYREARQPVIPKTPFQTGSISKSFTSVASLQFQGQGLLAIGNSHSPEFIRSDVVSDAKAIQAILPGGAYSQTLTL